MIDELEWVKHERPAADPPSAEARAAARTALDRAIECEQRRWAFRLRSSHGRRWLAPAVALAVTVAVVAVFLGVQARKTAQPSSGGGTELVFRAEPSAEVPVVNPAAVTSAVSVLRARLAQAGSVTSTGDTIFVHLRAGVRMNRAFLETLDNPGDLLAFYDWEANVLTPSGRPVAGLLRSGSPQALQISQGAATAGPGSPGAGSMTLFRAVTLASAQSEISAAQCAQQHCSRLGPEYFAFALPGTAGCAAGSPCYLAGPASSPSDLRTKLPPGVSLSHVQTVQIPQGTVILRAVASRGFGHAPPWSDPSAQYFVLRDRASLFGNEITNPRQSVDQSGAPDVTFGFTSKGSSAFQQATRRIAVRGSQVSLFGQSYLQHFAIAVGTQLISVPSIDFHVYPDGVSGAGGADITGGFTVRSARKLASQLRVPPLPVTLELLSVSPAAGAKSPAHVGAQLVSTDCMGNGGGGRTVIQSCHFILSDGQRFRCDHQLKGEPTNREINAAGCVPLRPLVLSSRQKALIVQIFTAKQCLATRGLRVVGGPVLPSGRRIPDGEIVVTGRHPTFIAFFIDSAKARRAAGLPAPRGRQVQRHGRVTIVWTWPPSTGLRAEVEACVF